MCVPAVAVSARSERIQVAKQRAAEGCHDCAVPGRPGALGGAGPVAQHQGRRVCGRATGTAGRLRLGHARGYRAPGRACRALQSQAVRGARRRLHSSVPCAAARSTTAEPVLARCMLSGMLLGTGGRACMAPGSAWLHAALPRHAPALPQVDAISSRAQPLVLSARKRARRVSDFVRRRSSLCVPPLGKLHER
jgi:hypothetical protein